MTMTEHIRRLRDLGVTTPRLVGEDVDQLFFSQSRRLDALIQCQDHVLASQAPLRNLTAEIRALGLHVLGNILSQAKENDRYLEYYDRQLWDLAEMMLQPDQNGRRCVSRCIPAFVQRMRLNRLFSHLTYVELTQVVCTWILIFQCEESAVSEHIMSCIEMIFCQFLTDQIRTRERQIARVLKSEKVTVEMGLCDECPICTDEVEPGQYITKLAPFCTHWFHSDCIKTWMMSDNEGKNTCPMCRTRLDMSR